MIRMETARKVADRLGARDVDIHQFRRGLEVELEHRNVTRGNLLTTGKIALAHLKEKRDYYSRLEAVEGRPKGSASLVEQDQSIRSAARVLHLTIQVDPRLISRPYRAMNPRAADLLDEQCPPHRIILDPEAQEPTARHLQPPEIQVGDERHEVVEYVVVGRLARLGVPRAKRYRIAHGIANKLQRRPGAERIVYGKVKVRLTRSN